MNTCLEKNSAVTERKARASGFSVAFLTVFAFLFCFLTFVFPDVTVNAVRESVRLLVLRLLPAVFPFAVSGEMLMRSGFPESAGKAVGKAIRFVTGIPVRGASAFLLGLFSGFPTGGKNVVTLYREGKINKSEAERVLPLCNNAGPAFVISAIGKGTWGSARFGVFLFSVSVLSSVAAGRLVSLFYGRVNTERNDPETAICKNPCEKTVPEIFTESAVSAINAFIRIFAFVLFFEILTGFFDFSVSSLPFGAGISACFSVFAELTSGAGALSGNLSGIPFAKREILTFGAVAWGGLSAHLQTASFAVEAGLGMKKYYLTKALSFLIAVGAGAFCVYFLL